LRVSADARCSVSRAGADVRRSALRVGTDARHSASRVATLMGRIPRTLSHHGLGLASLASVVTGQDVMHVTIGAMHLNEYTLF
jgi:hypothetical protein